MISMSAALICTNVISKVSYKGVGLVTLWSSRIQARKILCVHKSNCTLKERHISCFIKIHYVGQS